MKRSNAQRYRSVNKAGSALAALALGLFLAACGGGGGGNTGGDTGGESGDPPGTGQAQQVRVGDRFTTQGDSGDIVRRGSTPGTLNGVEGTFTCASQGCALRRSCVAGTNQCTVTGVDGVTFTPGSVVMTPPPTPATETEFAGLDARAAGYMMTALRRAAAARPRAGSITQSSNVRGGITADRVSVTARHGAGRNSYSIRNGSAWSIGTANGNPVALDATPPFDGQELTRRVNGGTLYVDVYSDIQGPSSTDTDYLAGGIWLFLPDNARSAGDVVVGAFGDGSDPFRQGNLRALQGTASYVGLATGIYTDRSENDAGYLDGNVALTADFGGGGDLGSISGSVSGIETDGERLSGSIRLGAAPIGSSDSGFFEGRLSGTVEGNGYSGRWGGQFFGNGEADGRPGSVGGTLGGTSASGDVSFIGVFGAYKGE